MNFFTLEMLLNNRDAFIKIISRSYPISNPLLEKYQDYWDWENIAANKYICWTTQLTEQYQDKFFAQELPQNATITWSVTLIEKFIKQKKLTWEGLMWQNGIFETPETTALCLSHWSKGRMKRMHPQLDDDKSDILNYRYIQHTPWGKDAHLWAANVVENTANLQWDLFSGVEGFPWTLDFIEKHEHQLDWDILSSNKKIPWTIEFIEKYQDKLNWRNLSCNDGLPWNNEILKKFAHKIDSRMLGICLNSVSSDYPINLQEIIENIPEKIQWASPDIDHGYWEGTLSGVFNSDDIYWTPELFLKIQSHIEAFFKTLEETTFDDWDDGQWNIDFLDKNANQVYWTYFAKSNNWSPAFFELMLTKQMTEGITTINWENICAFAKHLWTPNFINTHKESILQYFISNIYSGWSLPANPHFPWKNYFEEFEPHFTDRCFKEISANPNLPLSLKFLQQYEQKLAWGSDGIELRNDLTEEIITHYTDKLNWDVVARTGRTPIQVLQKFPNKIDWELVSRRDDLKLEDIDENLPWNWEEVFRNQNIDFTKYLPVETLEKFLKNL